ncbi:hypothetical protein AHF37_09599 [Paragonimus kellicotti]|nr:hypothetical protein AHF37_09599 [Paragonimus kellicotti]
MYERAVRWWRFVCVNTGEQRRYLLQEGGRKLSAGVACAAQESGNHLRHIRCVSHYHQHKKAGIQRISFRG